MSQGPSFWFDARIYLGVTAILLLIIAFYNRYLAILGAILLLALYLYGRERHLERQKALGAYLETIQHGIGQAGRFALNHLPLGIAVVDRGGNVHWHNNTLKEWFDGEIVTGAPLPENLRTILPDRDWEIESSKKITVGGRQFEVLYRPVDREKCLSEPLGIIYLADITEVETMKGVCHGAMSVLAYIQIDNISDVLKGLNDNQRSAIQAEVNKILGEWIGELNGFLKRVSQDLYIAVFDRKALDKVLNDKFDILDKIRIIQGGNKIPVTLSMGVAAEGSTIAVLGHRAQAGLDLALGRGGDQVAVDIGGKIKFYGGKSKAVEKNTRVKARVVAHALRELMRDSDRVLVMGHTGEDFDSLGAALGVSKMARHLGIATHIIVSQPGVAVGKLKELLPDYQEYHDIFITPAESVEKLTPDTLLFVVDTHRPEITAAPALLEKAERVIVIDHHRRAEDFIASPLLVYLEPSASSTSELVTELLTYFDDDIDLTRLEASALYAGIVVDTKNFVVQTGVRTFEAVAYLRRAGADPRLVRQLFRVDIETIKRRAELLAGSEMLPGGVVIGVCPIEVKNAQILAAQTADMLLNIEGVRVSFVIYWHEDGIVGVSARSQGDINVQVIMEQLDGGGHQTVAGAQVKGASIEEVKAKVIELATKYIEESVDYESNPAARS